MRQEFERDGYVILREQIPDDLIDSARRRAYTMHEVAGGLFGIHGAYVHGDGTHWHRRRVHGLPEVEALLKFLPVHELLGPEKCGITHSKFSFKRAGEEQTWAPHQDIAYKPEPRRGLTFAIPLEPVDASNGTLELLPNSHLLGARAHRNVPGMTQQIELAEAIDGRFEQIVAGPGDVAAFSLFTVHRSGSNRSHGLRAILFVEVEPFTERLQDEIGGPVTLI